ncbi:MAG TPA: aminopeptidase N [Streptosporangiaceae bacterium]|nr:aminopeptidase N [Streptosporangiaceae bacterium]
MTHNLTRAAAAGRARLLRVQSYQVELDLTGDDTGFGSLTTVRFSCASPGRDSFIDLTAPAVSEIVLNGQPLPLTAFDGNRIALPALAGSNELTVRAQGAYSRSGEGLHRFTDPADKGVYLYSDLETFDAHRIYACFDQPDLKSTFEFTVLCPDTWQVISNVVPDVSGQPAGPGIERWHFPPTSLMSTYITHVSAGPYHVVRGEHDGIPLGIFCRQSLAGYLDPDEIFEVTRQGFDFYHAAFGVRYPFGKYDQLFVPEFKAGAMENAGAVTFLEDYIFRSRVTDARREARAETILHEMAHMWFGDLVTMRWWDDLWLNESFATWAAAVAQSEATRWTNAWTTFSQVWKAWAYRQDQLPSTHPIAADIVDIEAVEVNFDGITYAKGAAVIKQLVAYVGSENFLSGLRSYFGQHAWGNASLADLLDALEQASGRQLSGWSKAWLEAPGVNTLRPVYETAADGTFTRFAVEQQAPREHPVLRPHRLAIGLYDRGTDGLARRRRIEIDVAGERTEVPELIGERRPDLILVNDDDLTFAKIRLDEHSLRTLTGAMSEFTDSLAATLCWAAAWDMCRDAEMPARDYVALVLSGADSVADITVLQSLLGQAILATRRFADPGWRPAGLAKLAQWLRGRLLTAEPGSDRQLAYAQSFISVATSAQDLDLLSDLLSGSVVVDGLVVDTDLRWLLLRRLVNRGVAGQDAIDAEHDRDRTDAGDRHAATCTAAIPDPAAKEAAWQLIVSGDLPNATFRAAVGGFQSADQEELTAPYAARFFEAVGDIWRDWGSDMAQFFVEYAYPVTVVDQAAIDAAADYLAHADPPAGLRRLLSEGRDDVIRALRCRERDAQPS